MNLPALEVYVKSYVELRRAMGYKLRSSLRCCCNSSDSWIRGQRLGRFALRWRWSGPRPARPDVADLDKFSA